MDIYLTDLETGEKLVFPMLPEKINTQIGTMFQSYAVQSMGEVRLPIGQQLTAISWEGILPGEKRSGTLYAKGRQSPRNIVKKWSTFQSKKKKLRLQVTGTPLDIQVYMDRYNVEYSGAHGDFNYMISLIQAKDLKVAVKKKSTGACDSRPSQPKSKTYTVVAGDSLWKIAQKFYGNGAKYPTIYNANKALIGKDPNRIFPGQVLKIP